MEVNQKITKKRQSLIKNNLMWYLQIHRSCMEPSYKLQILQEPHGDPLNKV